MQYTSKIVLLAVALFGSSALAAPSAESGYNLEAREVDNDISARELFDLYLEARADPSLDARALESLDFEAREYLEYLEAREATTVASEPPRGSELHQTLLSSQTPPSVVETNQHSLAANEHSHGANETTPSDSKHKIYLTPHEKSVRHAKKVAAKLFEENPEAYQAALADHDDKFHRFAVAKYLKTPKHLKEALADADSPYHKAAKRIVHKRKAKVYLSDKHNYKRALKHRHHKYYKDAVKVYFSRGTHFQDALQDKHSRFHKAAVHEYLLDTKTRGSILADPSNQYYKAAKKVQKKIDRRRHHHHQHSKVASDSLSANSTTTTTTRSA